MQREVPDTHLVPTIVQICQVLQAQQHESSAVLPTSHEQNSFDNFSLDRWSKS